jgi:hypothetical protein
VPGGERVCTSNIDKLPALVAWQIEQAGVRLGWYWHLRVTLCAWRLKWKARQ